MTCKRLGSGACLPVLALLIVSCFLAPQPAAAGEIAAVPQDIERLYASGQYRQAVEVLQTAVQRDPSDASLQYWLGRCLYELRDYGHAITSLEHAVMLDPSQSEYHDWLGKACGRRAEETNPVLSFVGLSLARRAHREFETAVHLDNTNLEAQRDLIRYLLNAPGIVGGGNEHAEQQIDALQRVDPVEADLARAEAFATHKKYEQASAVYQRILDARPSRIGVYFEVAEYDRDHADVEGMRQAIQAGAALAPDDRRLPYYEGVILVMEKKNLDVAEKDLNRYLDTVPDNTEVPARSSAHEWLGVLYEFEDKRDLAAEQYQAALVLDPRDKAPREALKRLEKK